MKKFLFDKSNLNTIDDISKFEEINERIKLLKNQIIEKEQEIKVLEESLIDFCPICNLRNFEIKQRHEEGTYFDRARTYEYKECNICGNRYDEKCTYIGSYG